MAWIPELFSFWVSFWAKILCKMGKEAASVFPVPVGAMSSTCWLARIGGIASSWGSVGCRIACALSIELIRGLSWSKTFTRNKFKAVYEKLAVKDDINSRQLSINCRCREI